MRAQIIDNLTENLSVCLGHCVQQVDCTRVALRLDGLDGFLRVRLIVHQPVTICKAPEHALLAQLLQDT